MKTVSEITTGRVTVTTARKTLYDLIWGNPNAAPAGERSRAYVGITLRADANNGAAIILSDPRNGGGFPMVPGFEFRKLPLDDARKVMLQAVSGSQNLDYIIQ